MHFEFATATRIVFGPGSLKELLPAARSFGTHALFVEGVSGARTAAPIGQLKEAGIAVTEFHVSGEPTVASVLSGLELARSQGCDFVIGMGGGSVIDSGKAIAALLSNPGDVYDYLEVVGKGGILSRPSVPYIAIPTTGGTGTEVTAQRGARGHRTARQGQPAQPVHAAASCHRRPRADVWSAS